MLTFFQEEAKVEKKLEMAQDTDVVKLGDASNASSFTRFHFFRLLT